MTPTGRPDGSEDTVDKAHQSQLPSEDEPPELPYSKPTMIAVLATATGAAFLSTMGDQAAVIVLPSIGRDLNIPNSRRPRAVSAYSVTFGCFLLVWGQNADVYGKRQISILGSGRFALMSLLVPFMPNETAFNPFRSLQGLGAAANVPTAL